MKKIMGSLLIVYTCMGFGYDAHAQTTGNAILNIHTIGQDGPAVKATRNFWKRNGEGKGEQWFRLSAGFLAEFTEGGILNREVYDKWGRWLYSIREYTEKELPREVWRLVKSTYFEYNIGFVKEVSQPLMLAYVVHIENEEGWKDLVVRDGEIAVSKEFGK